MKRPIGNKERLSASLFEAEDSILKLCVKQIQKNGPNWVLIRFDGFVLNVHERGRIILTELFIRTARSLYYQYYDQVGKTFG